MLSDINYLRANPTEVDGKETTLEAEKIRLTKAQADKAEMGATELKGELIRADEAEAAWIGEVTSMRAKMLSIPAKAAGEWAGSLSINESQDVLKRHISEALQELADSAS